MKPYRTITLALAVGMLISTTAAAQYVPVHYSGCGTARIDGYFDPAEWSSAAQKNFTIDLPGGATAPAILYLMNDNLNLFVAVRFVRSAADPYNAIDVKFDNDRDGLPSVGDDLIAFYYDPLGWRFPGWGTVETDAYQHIPNHWANDYSAGGTTDVEGAFGNDGQWSLLEISHELRSGDGFDIDLPSGTSIPFTVQTFVGTGTSQEVATNTPGIWWWDVFHAGGCYSKVAAGCGQAAIDAKVGTKEWSSAARQRFSLRTPGAGTTPATLLLMHDNFNLYTAVVFDRPAGDAGNSLALEYDSDYSDSMSDYDDAIVYSDGIGFTDNFRSTQPPCPLGAICSFRDTDMGGTSDGSGAFGNNGRSSSYEIAHPLSSGDGYDMSLGLGSSMGFFSFVRMIAPGGQWPQDFGDTRYPENGYLSVRVPACRGVGF